MSGERIKIQKFLADCAVCSRRGAEEPVRLGRVRVNGAVVTDPAIRVDPDKDVVEYDGRRIVPFGGLPRGLILYKTPGVVTSVSDPHNEDTVYDLLPAAERGHRWIYVGRLDKDSEGLVFFTDSGELAHRLAHPSYKVPKRYLVRVPGRVETRHLRQLERGLTIEGRLMRMDSVRVAGWDGDATSLEVVLHQGEKRQIRRMLERLGYSVSLLRRTAFGPLSLEGLAPGGCRRLTAREMKLLGREGGRNIERGS